MSDNPQLRGQPRRGRQGVSREQWLDTALETFEREGVDAVRVEVLARKVGVSKSGFYFHFRDRKDLLRSLLQHWESLEHAPIEYLAEVTEETALETLHYIAESVDRGDLSRFDAAIRQWAKTNPEVEGVYRTKMDIRLHTVRTCFERLGFAGPDLEMRARTFIAYVSSEREIFPEISLEDRRLLRDLRLNLLVQRQRVT